MRRMFPAPAAAQFWTDRGVMALTVSFKTVGCRLNQAETARFCAAFVKAGYRIIGFGKPCDVSVIHGCAVTAQAEHDTVRLAKHARKKQAQKIVIAGCPVAFNRPALESAGVADLLADQTEKFRLPELLHSAHQQASGRDDADMLVPQFKTTRALLKVQDGCDFRCAYCMVPLARGAARSRPLAEVEREAAALVQTGYREIVLTGANLGCYRDGHNKLPDLLLKLAQIPELARLRLSSIEISTVEDEVLRLMAGHPKICRFLHLPLQSGSNAILRAMGRRYTAQHYADILKRAVDLMPGIGIGADVLVGFPGESAADFALTEELVQALPLARLHVFSYSPRPGTRAAALPEQIPSQEKRRRARRIIEIGKQKQKTYAHHWIGREATILIERVSADGWLRGWTGEYVAARVHDPSRRLSPNQLVSIIGQSVENDVLISKLTTNQAWFQRRRERKKTT